MSTKDIGTNNEHIFVRGSCNTKLIIKDNNSETFPTLLNYYIVLDTNPVKCQRPEREREKETWIQLNFSTGVRQNIKPILQHINE